MTRGGTLWRRGGLRAARQAITPIHARVGQMGSGHCHTLSLPSRLGGLPIIVREASYAVSFYPTRQRADERATRNFLRSTVSRYRLPSLDLKSKFGAIAD